MCVHVCVYAADVLQSGQWRILGAAALWHAFSLPLPFQMQHHIAV